MENNKTTIDLQASTLNKALYRFNNTSSCSNLNSKEILGGKGANLAQMAKLNLPVPPGFTISTKVGRWNQYLRQGYNLRAHRGIK